MVEASVETIKSVQENPEKEIRKNGEKRKVERKASW